MSRASKWALFCALAASSVMHTPLAIAAETSEAAIAAQELGDALEEWAVRHTTQLLYDWDLTAGMKTEGVPGGLSKMETLQRLLQGTGLEYRVLNDRTISILPQREAARFTTYQQETPLDAADPQVRLASSSDAADESPVEVLVTGTSIPGVNPESSPLTVYSRDDIKRAGATTIEQFFDRLPANFNSLRANGAMARQGESNESNINGIDLRGLGVGTTLVLVNGRRLAPSSSGRTPDVSLIPIGAIERVEVLTDGASAIYGSDAVSGVVNFILRSSFEGAETAVGHGVVTSGSHDETHIEQSLGHSWGTGNALLSLGYATQSELQAADRDFAAAAGKYTLVPEDRRRSVFLSGRQDAGSFLSFSGDAMYSDRTSDTDSIRTTLGLRPSENIIGNEGKDIFLNMGADASLPNELHLQLLSTYSESNQDTDTQVLRTLPALSSFSTSNQESKNVDITAKLSGNIVELPSGSIRFSFGGGYAKDQYVFDSLLQSSASTSTVGGDLSRHSTYAFAETFIPLVSPQQGITAVNRLELTLAGRYTDYSDFGSATSPKLGLLWSPIHSLKLRGSYAKSFRAPFLTELDPSLTSWALLPLSTYPALARQYGLAPTANLLLAYGNNTALGPERAKSKTFGFDIAPESIPRFKLSATYFDIDYTDRIGRPDSGFLALRNPALFSSLFTLSPGVDQIAELISGARNFSNSPRVDLNDPAAVAASTALLYDDRNLNLAISELSGLDLGLSYKVAGLSFGTELSRLFHYNKQARPTDSLVAVVDQVGQPVSLRARSWVGFDRSSMSAQLGVNYVDSYSNASDPANPDVASWTTLDLSAAYASEAGYGLTQGLRFSLSIRNLLNRDPPSVPLSTVTNAGVLEQIGYDPSNADPIGRFISLEVIKRWGGGTH